MLSEILEHSKTTLMKHSAGTRIGVLGIPQESYFCMLLYYVLLHDLCVKRWNNPVLRDGWLVVWNMNFIFPYIGNHNPS